MPTSISTIHLSFQLYEFFTGNSIQESNIYKFVQQYGRDKLTYERFTSGQPLIEYTFSNYAVRACEVPYSGARFWHFGFMEREFLINYFIRCINISPSDRFKRDAKDTEMHSFIQASENYYQMENIQSFLSRFSNIQKSIPRLNKKGIEFKVDELFQPLHVRDIFIYLYNEIFGSLENVNEKQQSEIAKLKKQLEQVTKERDKSKITIETLIEHK